MFEEYLSLEPHEYPVCALWCMHSHLFAKFMHTPRLVLRSPVRECGKTTLLDVVAALVPYPYKSENMTAAVFFRVSDRGDSLLLDEVDNLNLLTNAAFRAALARRSIIIKMKRDPRAAINRRKFKQRG